MCAHHFGTQPLALLSTRASVSLSEAMMRLTALFIVVLCFYQGELAYYSRYGNIRMMFVGLGDDID